VTTDEADEATASAYEKTGPREPPVDVDCRYESQVQHGKRQADQAKLKNKPGNFD
jgi:hypothetical protein